MMFTLFFSLSFSLYSIILQYTDLLPALRSGYPGLAATPLNSNKTFITASVLWIATIAALVKFNNFLLDLGRNTKGEWKFYLNWLRPFACCRSAAQGGIDVIDGKGLKPSAINEMSMLAYYRHLYPKDFMVFPVVPQHDYILNRHITNLSAWGPSGHEVGPATGQGIWDPGSWGQYLGGTSSKKRKGEMFTDSTHIAGQARRINGCIPKMICSNLTVTFPPTNESRISVSIDSIITYGASSTPTTTCYTAPYVRCGLTKADLSPWTPLWNLHVHSKDTSDYKSQKCDCPIPKV
jgi:hypothetical protein